MVCNLRTLYVICVLFNGSKQANIGLKCWVLLFTLFNKFWMTSQVLILSIVTF